MATIVVTEVSQLAVSITEQAKRLTLQSHQLLILAGVSDGELAKLTGFNRIAVSTELCQKLLPLSNKRRVDEVEEVLAAVIAGHDAEPVLLDRIQLLFEPSLQLEVLRCLLTLSKSKPLIVNWPGNFDGKLLSFSRPGKPDYVFTSEKDLSSVPVLWMTGHGEQQ